MNTGECNHEKGYAMLDGRAYGEVCSKAWPTFTRAQWVAFVQMHVAYSAYQPELKCRNLLHYPEFDYVGQHSGPTQDCTF